MKDKKELDEAHGGGGDPGNGAGEGAQFTADDARAAGEAETTAEAEAAADDERAHEHEEVLQVLEQEAAEEDELLRDLERLQDRHLRLAAEFENYRKRTRRELAEMRRRAQAELVGRLLDILDDLRRVAHHGPEATVDSLTEGVGLVEAKMRKELGDAGLARIEAAGMRFDPNLHEALTTRSVDDPEEDDTVGNVLLEGYTFGDILVRPARVEVKKYSPPSAEPPLEEATAEQDDG